MEEVAIGPIGLRVGGAVVVLGTLAGVTCGCTDGVGPAPTPSSPSSGPPRTSATTDLTVSGTDAAGQDYTWHLTCDPPGGDHPDPQEACRVLQESGERALPPVPKGRVCPQVYGGPERASVAGTWRGRAVSSTFRRTDGCETSRWDALVGLLPRPGA